METRRFGRTGHLSSIAIFGAAALWEVTQEQADTALDLALQAGVNHIDVAPSYGMAEARIGPWLASRRDHFFLGCKTTARTRHAAAAELHQSLHRLQTRHFDLYQLHAVNSFEELDQVTKPGGALEAAIEARHAGFVEYIGITGHGLQTPAIFLEALQRFDFDSVLFPLNFILYADIQYRTTAEALLQECNKLDVGVMVIKSIARSPWGNFPKTHTTWYRPFTTLEEIQHAVDFALSQEVTGLCTAGDLSVLPLVLQVCQSYKCMEQGKQDELIASAASFETLFT